MQIEARDHSLMGYDESNKKYFRICNEVCVVKKHCKLGSYDTKSTLRIWYGERYVDFDVERTVFTARGMQKILLKKNVAVPDNKDVLESIVNYVLQTDEDAPTQYFHDRLGFVEINGELVYLSSSPIGSLTPDELSSRYIDMKSIDPKGDLDGWLQMVVDEVIGRIPLELALAIGASAPILHLLRRDGFFPELPVIALVGESSTGKTTAFRLMGSIDGSPAEGVGRLKDLNSTMNAFFSQMARQQGTIFLFDEATGKGDWGITDVLYSLVKGVERGRCRPDGTLNDRATFSGTVVLTAESSLLANAKLHGGILSRILELYLPLTESKEHADRLNKKVNEHHGWAIVPLVQYIMSVYEADPNVFKTMLDEEEKLLMQMKPPTKNIEGRIYRLYALIVISATIANEAWAVGLHVDEIRELLLEQHEKNQPVRSHALNLYDCVLAKVNANISLFPTKETQNFFKLGNDGQTKGMRERKDGIVTIWITKEAFHEYVKDKFPNPSDFFSELADQDLMVRDAYRHYTFKKTLSIGRCYCYGFKVNTYESDDPICLVLPEPVYVQDELSFPGNSDRMSDIGEYVDDDNAIFGTDEAEVVAS